MDIHRRIGTIHAPCSILCKQATMVMKARMAMRTGYSHKLGKVSRPECTEPGELQRTDRGSPPDQRSVKPY